MARMASTTLPGQKKRLLQAIKALIGDLRTNSWPLGARERPLTDLGGSWTQLTEEEAEAEPARAAAIERNARLEQDAHKWRGRLRNVLEDCQRLLNDYGHSEEMHRFFNNRLLAVTSSPEQICRELYTTEACLRDMESLKKMVTGVGSVPRGTRKQTPTSRLPMNLRRARLAHNHRQEEAAEEIGVTQSVYSLYETGRRRPLPARAKKCAAYIAKAPKTAQVALNKTRNNTPVSAE